MAGLMIEEQELLIRAGRTDDTTIVYCSDSTWITKMDKFVEKSPTLYKFIAEDKYSKTYEFPKKLLSLRSSIVNRTMTKEVR